MRNLPLQTKLIYLIAFMSTMLVAVGVLGLSGMKSARASLETLYKDRLVSAIHLATISELLSETGLEMILSVAHGRSNSSNLPRQHLVLALVNSAARIEADLAEMDKIWREYLSTYLTPEEKSLASSALSSYTALVDKGIRPGIVLMRDNDIEGLDAHLKDIMLPLESQSHGALNALIRLQDKAARTELARNASDYRARLTISVIGIALALLVGIVISALTIRSVTATANRLRESEKRYRTLFESANDALLIMSGTTIIDCNKKALEMFDGSREQLVGNSLSGISTDLQADGKPIDDEVRSRLNASLEGQPQLFEWHHKRLDGSPFDAEISLNPIELEGEVVLQGIVRDISERKRAEKELVESERRFRTLFEQAAVGVAEIDPLSGRFLRVNERYCDIVGLSPDEMLKTDFQSITQPEDLAADLNNMKLLLAGEIREFSMDKRYIRKDGGIVWVNLTVYPTWLGDESPSRHIAIIIDITKRKKAEAELREYRVHLEDLVSERTGELKAANEKLKELDKLKSMFIASMSHELRTPLNSIIGFTGMTLQGLSGELNGEQQDNLSRAYQAAKHLLSLISDVIDISKIEAGRIESYPEAVSLDNIVDEAVGTVRPQLKEKGLELAVEVPGDVQLNTDRKRLLQCLLNLLSNAVKFTESGTITVAARETDGEVMISVSDTGIGIAEKDQPKVFEAFERLETHLRVKAGGTGLGLYLTKKLARDILRGDVLFQSKEGQGSTFTLSVPKDLQQNPDSADMPDTTGDIG